MIDIKTLLSYNKIKNWGNSVKQVKKIFDIPIVKIISKIISWIVLSFLVLLAVILVYYVISSKIFEIKGKSGQPDVSLYTIISPSMEHTINVYDVVVTFKVKDVSTIKEGDIITFISDSSLGEGLTITHRVKEVIKTGNDIKFRTKGDNNPIPDSALVSSDKVLGKVVFKIPFLGRIQFLLQSKSGWIFALLIPAFLIVVYDVFKVIRLSNIKQKVSDSIQEEKEDENLTSKKDNLKKQLQNKFISINKPNKEITQKPIDNNINQTPKEENIVAPKEDNNKVEFVEYIKDNGLDMDRIKNNIEKIEQDEFDVQKVMANISKLNSVEEDDFELPKTK